MDLKVVRLSDRATLPSRGSTFSAGLDLYSTLSGVLQPLERVLIPLDIAIELPESTFGHVLSRSGLSVKHGIHVGAGVIDEDYRGNVSVLLYNLGNKPFEYNIGDRIAQLVIKKYESVNVVEGEYVNLKKSLRDQNGFGSTGN
jgi:dUTP pyrophosphatase